MLLGGGHVGLLIGVLIQFFDVQPFIASLGRDVRCPRPGVPGQPVLHQIEDPAILWLQDEALLRRGLVPRPDRRHRTAGRRESPSWSCTRPASGAPSTPSAGNEQSARLMGLPVVRTKLLAYVISGVCAGPRRGGVQRISGRGYPLNGIGTELETIAAVVSAAPSSRAAADSCSAR
jgi:simple sugar transport system permease protein